MALGIPRGVLVTIVASEAGVLCACLDGADKSHMALYLEPPRAFRAAC